MLVLLAGCWLFAATASGDTASAPESRWRGEWRIGDSAAHAVQPERLERTADRIGGLDGVYGVLLAHGGELIVERYFRDGFREKPHNLKSASKSLLSALTGIAVAEGHFDLEQPIAELLPQGKNLDDPRKRTITVRHLLNMTTGLEAMSYEGYNAWIRSDDWVAAALRAPVVAEPGTLFQYSTANTHLLSAVLTATTGMSTKEYAEARLLGPMGVQVKGWEQDPTGIYVGGNNLSMTPRDMARFGQLYLDGGRWGDAQLVPQSWIEESTRPAGKGFQHLYGSYGYLWYVDMVADGAFIAVGFGGQYIYVSPAHDAVLVVTSTLESKGDEWAAELFRLIRNDLLPALGISPAYYARRGLPPGDPALESLARAMDRAARAVSALEALAPGPPASPARGRTVSRVNLRQGPGLGEERLAVIAPGVKLQILDQTGSWVQARTGELQGWLHSQYLELDETSWRGVAADLRAEIEEFDRFVSAYLAERGLSSPEAASPGGPAPEAALAELSSARQRIISLETDLSSAEEARLRLADELTRLETDRSALHGERTALIADLNDEASRLAEVESARDRLVDEVADVRAELAALGGTLRQARVDRDRLDQELRAALELETDRQAELAESRAARQALAQELESTHAELAGRREMHAEAQVALNRLSRELDDARERLAGREAELADARAELVGRKAELIDARAELVAREVELTESRAARQDMAQVLARLEAERGNLRLELAALSESLADGGSRLGAAEAAREHLAQELQDARAELASRGEMLDETQAERDRLAGELGEAQERLASREAELAKSRTVRQSLKNELRRLEAERSAARSELAALTAGVDEGQSREAAAEVARDRLAGELEDARADLASRAKSLQEAQAEKDRLAHESREAREGLVDRRGELAEAVVARDRLAQELEDARADLASRAKSLQEAEAEKDRLAHELREAREGLADRGGELAKAVAARDRLAQELENARAVLTEREANHAGLGHELSQMQARTEAGLAALAESEAKREALIRDLETAQGWVDDLEERLVRCDEARVESRAGVARLGEASEVMEMELAEQLDASREELERLRTTESRAEIGRSSGVAVTEPAAGAEGDEGAAPRAAGQPVLASAAVEEQVAAVVRRWSRAWSSQNAELYLSLYGEAFQPPRGLSRPTWEAQRRQRLAAPQFIRVGIQDLRIYLRGADRAVAHFGQIYESERLSLRTTKLLVLAWEEDQWRIVQELRSAVQ